MSADDWLLKAGLQQKTAVEPKVIMCPRCQCPNEPTATLCVKCKSVLRLQDAVSISTVQKKLEDQNNTIEKMQAQLHTMSLALDRRIDEEEERDQDEDSEDSEEKEEIVTEK